jgi:hypothetical protein
MQKASVIPDEGGYLTEGKKVLPIAELSSTYKRHSLVSSPSPHQPPGKGGKGKGKDGKGKSKGKRSPMQDSTSVSDDTGAELWMLLYPESVNQENGSYLILGYNNSQVRVTKENWDTLRFNTKTSNTEYFPSSYRDPIPTGPSLEDPQRNMSFPRSTITGTLEDLCQLLKAPILIKSKKISSEVYKALSLDGPSGASNAGDEETASRRILMFLRLCAAFIPCEHEDYHDAVAQLDTEVNADLDIGDAALFTCACETKLW